MKLYHHQLDNQLQGKLLPIYFIFGDELLICQQNCQAIRQKAHRQGFNDPRIFYITPSFDWQSLTDISSTSLFSNKRLIDLRLMTDKVSPPLQKFIVNYQPHPDQLLLISGYQLNKAKISQQKWYQHIDQHGVIVTIWPMRPRQQYQWIGQQLAKLGFHPKRVVIDYINRCSEGNLLAAQQVITQITILFEPGVLELEQIKNMMCDQTRFSLFALTDPLKAGDCQTCRHIIQRLQSEGKPPLLVLWLLTKAIYQQLQPPATEPTYLYQLLNHAHAIDGMIKGAKQGDVWLNLEQLCLNFCKRATYFGPSFKETQPSPLTIGHDLWENYR